MKRASQGQQKGNYVRAAVLLDDFIQPGWRGVLSVWSAGWEHLFFRLIQDSLRSSFGYQVIDAV